MFTIDLPASLDLKSESGWNDLSVLLNTPHTFLIASHKNPDGDAVGSALGLALALKELGHLVTVALPDDSPNFLKWLPGHKDILLFERKSGKKIKPAMDAADALIFVDFNSPDRLGGMESLFSTFSGPGLLIDHHPPLSSFTDVWLVDPSKSSTSELVYLFLEKLAFSHQITRDAATCLLAGIMTDTVGFQVNSSYPGVFEVVARLIEKGAEKDRINQEVYSMFSPDRMRLLGFSLEKKMTLLPEYRAAYIALSRTELNKYNHKKGDTEGFVNYPLSVSGVDFSVLFTEQETEIKLSLRSKGLFAANTFAARYFNGGGHLNAAGGRFYGTMDQAVEYFINSLKEFV